MTTTEHHTSRGHQRHLVNLERRSLPIPTPGNPPDPRMARALYRAGHPLSAGRLYLNRQHNGFRGRTSTGSKVPFWSSVDRRRRRGFIGKLARRVNRPR